MRNFLSYVEIQTKITSLFTFFYTIAFLLYNKQEINLLSTVVFFLSMFLFDLTTTAINNYIDTKTNNQSLTVSRSKGLFIIFLLLSFSILLGIYLVFLTDLVIFLIGGLCFLCGILYTYGPIPISRQPLGEIISGLFYGLMIPFIIIYINMPPGSIVSLVLDKNMVEVKVAILPVIKLIALSILPMCTTANIMLANNICDLKKDIEVKRYTLPYYLGKKRALTLFVALYYIVYIDLIIMVLFKLVSPVTLLFLLTILFVQKNISLFLKEQNKKTTFICSIKNFIIIMGASTILIFLTI